MLDKIDRHALFHEMHRSIEESATMAVNQMNGKVVVSYPPNGGLLADELAALKSIPLTPVVERALRKLIADAAAYPLFHLLSLVDGVADPPELHDVQEDDRTAAEIMLHDGLYESYWAWRRRRPNPGWRLDNFEGE